jgi:hypothetical protein
MNPTQDPQQPPTVPQSSTPPSFGVPVQESAPLVQQPVPQPSSPPIGPTSSFSTPTSPVPTPPPAPATSGFGSGTMSGQVSSATPLAYAASKQGLNKKLLIIVGAVIVVIAIAAVVFLVLKPGGSGNPITKAVNSVVATVAPASQLTKYSGTAFSISYPKTLKPVDISSVINAGTTGSEGIRYSTDGTSTGDGSITSVGVASTPYTTDYPRATELQTFASGFATPVADSATSKDVTIAKTTVQGFETYKETGIVLKDGNAIAHATSEYVFGNKNLYIIAIEVRAADDATIGAETAAILSSFKANE